MIYENMLNEVKRRIGSKIPAMSEKIPVWLDLGQKRLEQEGNYRFQQNDYIFTMPANTKQYVLPSNYKDLFSLRCTTTNYKKRLEDKDIYDLEKDIIDFDSEGTPYLYYIWGTYLYTYPTSTVALSYHFRYYAHLPALVPGVVSNVPEIFQEAIIFYATYLAALEFETAQDALLIKDDFLDTVKRLKRMYLPSTTSSQRIRF